MTRHRRTPANPKQLGFRLGSEDFTAATEIRGVFSAAYLARHLRSSKEFASEQEISEAYQQIYDLWQQHAIALARRNEAFTCATFIEPVLDLLGWRQIPQEAIPSGLRTRKTPDYCLFTSDSNFTSASQADANTLLRFTATVLEAKKYLHPLDQISTRETPGWYPSQQIQDYLNRAKDSFGRRFFNWAILTNGAEWRLYTDHSAAGAYFAFHLIQSGEFCPLEDFKTFFILFRASAFERGPDDTCFLDGVQEQSLRIQADLETNLRKRIFSVLEDMGTAFLDFEENHLTEIDFPAVYDNALIFLYRLLFILYAESRDLLPVMSRGPGSNRRYFHEFSLSRLVERLRDKSQYTDCGIHCRIL